jgi:hypothetical protein
MAKLTSRLQGGAGLFLALLTGCTEQAGYIYTSPDGAVGLHVRRSAPGPPKAGELNRVWLVGVTDSAPEVENAEVLVGAFSGPWPPASIAWTDATTINVCPLAGARDVRRRLSVPVKMDGTRRWYRITTDCARQRRSPPLAHQQIFDWDAQDPAGD